jgi:shikimate dehydrogenase
MSNRFGLIGKTLKHSFSKAFFDNYFKTNQLEATYQLFEISSADLLKDLIEKNNLRGVNVTIPYKEDVIPFLNDLSEEAKEIGAVNVILNQEGVLKGFNTDAYGFHQSIKPFLCNIHERALILGTGGASKAIAFVFRSLGIDVIHISRTPIGEKQFAYEDVNNHMLNACKVIVNCTPVGTFPNVEERICIPYQFLTKEHLVIDLIYNPEETEFLRLAKEQGATTLNGESMLKHQALKSWEIWSK